MSRRLLRLVLLFIGIFLSGWTFANSNSKRSSTSSEQLSDDHTRSEDCHDNETNNSDLNTLRLTTVVFRHGDRVPDAGTVYPNYPYINHSFFPYNLGDLTRKGQKRMFNIGQSLQLRYRKFLGDVYFNDLISSVSSSYIRCQMSTQAFHAGLFYTNQYNPVKDFPWQSVPYYTIPIEQDRYISVPGYCPSMISSIQYPERDEIDDETRDILEYLDLYSGYDKVTFLQAMNIFDHTKTSLEQGLPPPEWVEKIYPQPLLSAGMKFWQLWVSQKNRLTSGPLVQRITNDAVAKAEGNSKPSRIKMYVYSGHDATIHNLLHALNLWNGEYINYSAFLVFELHKIDNQFGFKVYMQNNYEPRLLNIPGCGGVFCKLDTFIQLTEHLNNPEPVCT